MSSMLLNKCNYFVSSVPDDFKVNPGAVEAIAVHPTNSDKVRRLLHWFHLGILLNGTTLNNS